MAYERTTARARYAPTLESSFMVPALTALGTCAALTVGRLGLALLFGWSLRVVAATFAAVAGRLLVLAARVR